MGTRMNILTSPGTRDDFLDAMVALDQTPSGIMASEVFTFLQANHPHIQMRGIEQELNLYDLFALWHVVAMRAGTPPGSGRNAAHGGPIFLPWHRHFMLLLEQWMQLVLDKPDFGLPYWDWAEDGELFPTQQWQALLWTADYLGESRNDVVSGPMGDMRVRLWEDDIGTLWSISPRPMARNAGRGRLPQFRILPNKSDVNNALQESRYDESPYSMGSDGGHRNVLEGWVNSPQLHNLVHVWIGGDMSPGTSPNDPAFFLNHCNVDRIWQAWMNTRGQLYEPLPNAGLPGHELDDSMLTLFGQTRTPMDVLDPSPWYDYDSLVVN